MSDVVNDAARDFFRFGYTSVGTDRREKSFMVPNDECSVIDHALGQLVSGDVNNVEARCFDNFYSEEFQLSVSTLFFPRSRNIFAFDSLNSRNKLPN